MAATNVVKFKPYAPNWMRVSVNLGWISPPKIQVYCSCQWAWPTAISRTASKEIEHLVERSPSQLQYVTCEYRGSHGGNRPAPDGGRVSMRCHTRGSTATTMKSTSPVSSP